MVRQFSIWLEKLQKRRRLARHAEQLEEAFEERDNQPLTAPEQELLGNAVGFATITADEVAVPRTDLVTVAAEADFAAVLGVFQESQHSRLPVQGQNLDDIVGVVHLKDVVTYVGREQDFDLAQVQRPVTFVPETMTLPQVMQQMRKTRVPMVMVADEYGGTTGLVSMRDILEQLVGEIEDEHDELEAVVTTVAPGHWRVPPTLDVSELVEFLATQQGVENGLGDNLLAGADDEVVSVGGLVLKLARRVPAKGDRIPLAPGLLAVVTASDGRRIGGLDLLQEPRPGFVKEKAI